VTIKIEVRNCQSRRNVDVARLEHAVAAVMNGEGIENATISVAVVDDPAIHALNKQYLEHDYPTDVLSFVLEESDEALEGEVIVSVDTAETQAQDYGWSFDEELTLYVIHGSLHLVGYDDHTDEDRNEMRLLEERYLKAIGLQPPEKP
jgi:probable rRNA maturation factor